MGRRASGRGKMRECTKDLPFELVRTQAEIDTLYEAIEDERGNPDSVFTDEELIMAEQTLDWAFGRSDARPIPEG